MALVPHLRAVTRSLSGDFHFADDIAQDTSPITRAEQESRIAAFKRAFRSLSTAHREVLVLAAVHGLPYEQIAEICGCELGTVKIRVNWARAVLKRMLLLDVADNPRVAAAARGRAPVLH